MVVFPKQICKRFLPDTGESRSDKTFFLKTNMELEVCTSLGSMFHRRGALFVKEIRPATDAGWNGPKSPWCRPRVPCWRSWNVSFSRSNAGADCWWQRRMVVTSCRDQRWDKRVSFKFLINGKTSSWGWTPARHRTAFLHSARRRSCWPVGINWQIYENLSFSYIFWSMEGPDLLKLGFTNQENRNFHENLSFYSKVFLRLSNIYAESYGNDWDLSYHY